MLSIDYFEIGNGPVDLEGAITFYSLLFSKSKADDTPHRFQQVLCEYKVRPFA